LIAPRWKSARCFEANTQAKVKQVMALGNDDQESTNGKERNERVGGEIEKAVETMEETVTHDDGQ